MALNPSASLGDTLRRIAAGLRAGETFELTRSREAGSNILYVRVIKQVGYWGGTCPNDQIDELVEESLIQLYKRGGTQ